MVLCRIGAAGFLEASAFGIVYIQGSGGVLSFAFVPWGFKASAEHADSSIVFLLLARPANETQL